MPSANATIAILTSSEFKWTPQIQLMESLSSREEAIEYASMHGCNLIVQYSRRSGPLFDVLMDPNLVSTTAEAKFEVAERVPVEVRPESTGLAKAIFGRVFSFAKRFAAAPPSHGESPVAAANN